MADKETGLIIPVSAYADKDSAKAAVNELTKGVLSSLKDGYIEVPAEIKASYTRGSKELEKAQKDVIQLYEKMSKEGFSSSVDDLDDLIEKYKKFKSLAGKEGKGNSRQTRWLTKNIGETLQPYLTQKRELDKIIASFEDSVSKIEKSTKKSTAKKPRNFGTPSKEEIDNDIKQDQKRKMKGLKGITPKEPRTGWVDPGATNEYEVQRSEQSSYRSNLARQMRQSEKDFYKDPDHKATVTRPHTEEFNKIWEEAKGKSKTLSAEEKAKGLSATLLDKTLPSLLHKILAGDDVEALSKQFLDTAEAIYTLSETAGVDVYKVAKAEIGKTIGQFYNTKGNIGGTDGTDKTLGSYNTDVEAAIKGLFDIIEKRVDQITKARIETEKLLQKSTKRDDVPNNMATKLVNEINNTNKVAKESNTIENRQSKQLDTSYTQDIRESSRESMADTAEGRINRESLAISKDAIQIATEDASTGFNSDTKADSLLKAVQEIGKTVGETTGGEETSLSPYILKDGLFQKTKVEDKTGYTGKQKRIIPTEAQEKKTYQEARFKRARNGIEEERDQIERGEHESQQRTFLTSSEIKTYAKGIFGSIQKVFEKMNPPSEVDRIMAMNKEEQARARAERLEMFGENRGKNLSDTGDKAGVKRVKELFGWIYKRDGGNKELFQDVKLTPGFTGESAINTTAIMESLNKVLSGPEMFKAQTGGTFRNIIGSMTGYVGMDSLEKSRAQAEGLNQVMSNVRKEVLALLQGIESKEMALSGMQQKGTAKFDKEGRITSDSSSIARKTFVDLEEQKGVLKSALAEVMMIDQVVGKSGGKIKKILQNIGFVMPELREQNVIIQNINAGLDKNGKALKFQKRTGEVLNYSFQLMSRHIGQMLKNWMMQLNPINLIKKAFGDFAGYSTKWQRTMNVVKNNLRSIILPIMEKIAQLLVNMLGVLDIVLQKVQKAFGRTPISLFDQENAQKFKEEVEEINSVSAGFDELHDIGSDSDKSADNLMGEIYKPQLSEEWQNFADKLGDIFVGIAKAIQWCIDNWKLLAGLLAAFVVAKGLWNLLNVASSLSSLFGGMAKIPWAGIAKGLGWVAAAAATAASAYETVKLGNKWDQMDNKEKDSTIGKSVGFGTLAGGIIGTLIAPGVGTAIGAGLGAAITGGIDSAISDYNGDDARAELTGALGGAGLGATIGTLIAPGIGTAVGAAIGAGVGWGVEKLSHVGFSNGGDYSNLKISTEDLAWANEQLATAQDNAFKSLYNLKSLEEQAGQSGKELYDAVASGAMNFEDMSSAQMVVYDAYEQHISVIDELNKAQKQQMDYESSMDLDRAKHSDNYEEYINKMMDANEDGIYSNEELQDRFSQVYGELDRDSRKIFLEQLPDTMKESVKKQGTEYLSNWSKFYDNCCTNWDNFKTGWGKFWTGVGTAAGTKWEEMKTGAKQTWENMKTNASTTWENMKTTAGNIWNSIKIEAGEIWESIKNSAIGQKVQETAKNVETKWNEMKTNAATTWENIKTKASKKWEEIKDSAIGKKVQETWKNVTTKFNEIKTDLGDSWSTLKSNASTYWTGIKDAIVNAAKNAWDGAKGFFVKIGDKLSELWEGFKEFLAATGEKLGNFVSGNGYKTNAEVNSRSVPSMAVGTNYVPNDGLVYLHQGEAVIPKKYNRPYEPGGMSSEERAYMTQMMSTMRSLDNTMKQGINVNGQFVQRGSDLVAVVNRTKSQTGADLLSNVSYAR